MKSFKTTILALAALAISVAPALANVPWGTTAPVQQASATPTCTYTATALACIDKMGADVTALTLAGMTAGTYYTMVWMQDGTGSRALTQTPITGAPALSTAESAANGYAVWIIKATSASAATFVADYDNTPLLSTWTSTQASNGTAVAPGAIQAQPTIVAPGMAVSNECVCQAQTLPATWQTGIVIACLPLTNAVQCIEENPTAGTITPTAVTVNVRLVP